MKNTEHLGQTLEQTMKNLEEKSNLTNSEQKLVICKCCGKNEATEFDREYICKDCFKKRKIEIEIKEIIPTKYLNIDTDKKEMFKDLQNISVFLTGGSGCGKTVFSCSLAKRYIRNGYKVKFISFPAFIMELQSSFKKDRVKDGLCGSYYQNSFEIAEDIAKFDGVLVIDDLGAEKLTEFVRQIIYFIVNEREQRCLTTIITSNFSLAELDEYIDSRISSRIAGMCKVIKMTGKDRRLDK